MIKLSVDHNSFRLISPYGNTYSFTKYLAEKVCQEYSVTKNLPIVIFRPSIISTTVTDPEPKLIDTMFGVNALMFTFALGYLRNVHSIDKSGVNIISVDACAKGIIVSAWKKWKDLKVEKQSK